MIQPNDLGQWLRMRLMLYQVPLSLWCWYIMTNVLSHGTAFIQHVQGLATLMLMQVKIREKEILLMMMVDSQKPYLLCNLILHIAL